MVKIATGNLLDSPAEGLVNTVNTVGVMGKGIALQFKQTYPHNYRVYRQACKDGSFTIGQVLSVWDQSTLGRKCILNFPTKKHWRNPSKYEYIAKALPELLSAVHEQEVSSLAIPPLGCGNGGLDWARVRPMIEEAFAQYEGIVYLYPPKPDYTKDLRERAIPQPARLTPRRAMVLQGLYAYEREGEPISLLAGNKIVYLIQRLGQDMNLVFQPYIYGPYNPAVTHVMAHFNGSYLRGLEDKSARPFDALELQYDTELRRELDHFTVTSLSEAQRQVVYRLQVILQGYSSALGIELLSSVDYILNTHPSASTDDILEAAGNWNNRKRKLLRRGHVAKVRQRLLGLAEQGWLKYSNP